MRPGEADKAGVYLVQAEAGAHPKKSVGENLTARTVICLQC